MVEQMSKEEMVEQIVKRYNELPSERAERDHCGCEVCAQTCEVCADRNKG